MNTMNHKGYTARIEFDERDNIFVGRVLGLHTLISFHGETVAELRAEFETAIEDFLRDCKERAFVLRSRLRASSCCACRPRFTVRHWSPRRRLARA